MKREIDSLDKVIAENDLYIRSFENDVSECYSTIKVKTFNNFV